MVEVSHVHIPGSTRPSFLPPIPLPRVLPARCMSNNAYLEVEEDSVVRD